MVQLPEVPEAVDHAVVRPEERIVGGGRYVPHRSPDPDVDAVVDALELRLEGEEVAVFEDFIHFACPRQRPGRPRRPGGSGLARIGAAGLLDRRVEERVLAPTAAATGIGVGDPFHVPRGPIPPRQGYARRLV